MDEDILERRRMRAELAEVQIPASQLREESGNGPMQLRGAKLEARGGVPIADRTRRADTVKLTKGVRAQLWRGNTILRELELHNVLRT